MAETYHSKERKHAVENGFSFDFDINKSMLRYQVSQEEIEP